MGKTNSNSPLRLMIWDDTCRGTKWPIGLTHSWVAGSMLYKLTRTFDAAMGFPSWSAALQWAATVHPERRIGEIQFWGHGKWGRAMIDRDVLDESCLDSDHPYHQLLTQIRDRMDPESRWWFRTCETIGAVEGQAFARKWTDFFNCAIAGHTYIIGPWQSGLHVLEPGFEPDWSVWEGIADGTPESPRKALWSKATSPNTISFLQPNLPKSVI